MERRVPGSQDSTRQPRLETAGDPFVCCLPTFDEERLRLKS